MDVHDQDEECQYFLNTFENIEKQEFPLLLMELLDEPVEAVLKLINKIRMKINDISTDKVPTVRKFFLEYIPNILIKLRAVNNQALNEYLYEYLVDTIFGEFFSEEVIFRQLARKIILHLLDRQLLTEAAVEQCVQNVLKSHANDDLPIFMFYIAPILGAEQTQKYFWKIFLEVIEGDPGSVVRKQCVRLIAVLGSILGQEITERDLLPIFVKLSKTSEWTIRKECALELPKISVLCTKQSREQVLTPVMEELLTDANKWVHTAAAEKLGIYISTFAQPEILTLAINQEGDLYVVNVADDNENYKDMLSEEKLKNYQFYEDMFAETLIPTGADLGRTFGGVPLAKLFSSAAASSVPSSSVYQDPLNASMANSSKTIICDSAWYNSMSPSNPFMGNGTDSDNERLVTATDQQKPPTKEEGSKVADPAEAVEEDNPYQKFVHPNFLINLSSFIMNTSCTSPSSSTSGTPSSPVTTNPFHPLPPLMGMNLASERDFDYQNLYKNSNNNNNKSSSITNLAASAAAGSQDSNGNDVAGNTTTTTEEGVKADDLVNNNNEAPSVSKSGETCPLDNNNKRDVMDASNNNTSTTTNDNNQDGEPMEGSQLELELAKLSLSSTAADEDDVKRTSAHMKRATPEGLPSVIKMAIKDKKKNKKGGLKGLTLPTIPLQQQDVAADNKANSDDEDNKNNNAGADDDGHDKESDSDYPSPPQTPSIEDAPTSCPFGSLPEKDDAAVVKTPETARIMDMEEQIDIFAAAGDGNEKKGAAEQVASTSQDQEFFSNNYWYVKPPELTLDDLEQIEKSAKVVGEFRKEDLLANQQSEEESQLEKSLPPPPPPQDDDDDEDLPEPMEKRRLFSLYSIKYNKSYKLGEDPSGSGIMSSSMKASRDELLDNLFSNDSSQQSSHLMMVKKSDINPQLVGQRVLPPILLHFFLEMSNFPEWDQICAYSFPAVVLTMGKTYWPLLKGQLQTLCCAIRWEVRQIVVASIYQIALIIGRDHASQDLVPVFLGFFKDVDNVKIEALHNVAKFLQVIDKRRHIEVVAHLGECLEPENVTNWRFRKDLAQEILKLMDIYKTDLEEHEEAAAAEEKKKPGSDSPPRQDDLALINEECLKYLTGYALRLLMDRVHCVREVAMEAIVSRVRYSSESQLWDLLAIIVSAFAKSSHWRRRQIFGQLCETLIQQNGIDWAEFDQRMLSVLIDMADDKVPNVRLVVGKCLYKCTQSVYFTENLERRLKLEVILRQLETDSDRDVRASTNVPGFSDDSRVDETVDTNRTTYLDETIECEPSGSSVPEVVVVGTDEDEEAPNQVKSEVKGAKDDDDEAESSEVAGDTDKSDQRP